VTQEFAGAPDLDIKPADNTDFVKVGRIFAEAGNEIRADLFYNATHWTPATKIELDLDGPADKEVAALACTAANGESGTLKFVPTQTGWHSFRIRSVDTPAENEKPIYFLKVRYTAPQKL
jgi:alpha-amylase